MSTSNKVVPRFLKNKETVRKDYMNPSLQRSFSKGEARLDWHREDQARLRVTEFRGIEILASPISVIL